MQDPTHWILKLLSTAIVGLIINNLTTGIFTDAVRSRINIHRNHAGTTKIKNKEKRRESRQEQIVSKTLQQDESFVVMGQTNWKKERELQEDKTTVKRNEEVTSHTIRR